MIHNLDEGRNEGPRSSDMGAHHLELGESMRCGRTALTLAVSAAVVAGCSNTAATTPESFDVPTRPRPRPPRRR
jgi:hypothetical protein